MESSPSHRPLVGRRVVMGRGRAESIELTSSLEDLGAEVVHLELLPIVAPADSGAALRRHLAEFERFDWIVFTSANAVGPVVAAAASAGTRWPLPVRIGAVGTATADAVRAAGAEVDFVPPRATGAALGASLPAHSGQRVLAPLAELAGSDLEDQLSQRGLSVTRVDAYRLGPPPRLGPELIEAVSTADAVLLTSPSTVDRFDEQLAGHWPSVVVTIGPSTTARCAQLGLTPTEQAEPPGLSGLVEALVNTLGT